MRKITCDQLRGPNDQRLLPRLPMHQTERSKVVSSLGGCSCFSNINHWQSCPLDSRTLGSKPIWTDYFKYVLAMIESKTKTNNNFVGLKLETTGFDGNPSVSTTSKTWRTNRNTNIASAGVSFPLSSPFGLHFPLVLREGFLH